MFNHSLRTPTATTSRRTNRSVTPSVENLGLRIAPSSSTGLLITGPQGPIETLPIVRSRGPGSPDHAVKGGPPVHSSPQIVVVGGHPIRPTSPGHAAPM